MKNISLVSSRARVLLACAIILLGVSLVANAQVCAPMDTICSACDQAGGTIPGSWSLVYTGGCVYYDVLYNACPPFNVLDAEVDAKAIAADTYCWLLGCGFPGGGC
jgi:hypothetical protein